MRGSASAGCRADEAGSLRSPEGVQLLPGRRRRLQIRLVIRDEPESPLDQRRVVLVERLPPVQECHDLLLERILLAGLVEDLENLHREEPIIGVFLLLRLPDFAEPLVAHLALADIAHLRIETLQSLALRV